MIPRLFNRVKTFLYNTHNFRRYGYVFPLQLAFVMWGFLQIAATLFLLQREYPNYKSKESVLCYLDIVFWILTSIAHVTLMITIHKRRHCLASTIFFYYIYHTILSLSVRLVIHSLLTTASVEMKFNQNDFILGAKDRNMLELLFTVTNFYILNNVRKQLKDIEPNDQAALAQNVR